MRPVGYSVDQPEPVLESADYAACTLILNGLRVQYRVAKNHTDQSRPVCHPVSRGPIQPFEVGDRVDMSEGRVADLARVKALLTLQG